MLHTSFSRISLKISSRSAKEQLKLLLSSETAVTFNTLALPEDANSLRYARLAGIALYSFYWRTHYMDHYKSNLVWIDLEMTGLDIERDTILEIATVITTNELEIVAEGPVFVIHQPDEVLAMMDEWNSTYHTASGLVQAVKESTVTMAQAEEETVAFIALHAKPQAAPLCGNSVWQDKRFLSRYMPLVDDFLHYRIIDVSSVKELARRWYPESCFTCFSKPENHRAYEDIVLSVEELKHYRKYFFVE